MSARSVPSIKQLVSSANKIDVSRVDTSPKSLTYRKNSDGPRIEPCGTPQVIGKMPESVPLKLIRVIKIVNIFKEESIHKTSSRGLLNSVSNHRYFKVKLLVSYFNIQSYIAHL